MFSICFLAQNLKKRELVNTGGIVMMDGNLNEVNLTVIIPEGQYGLANLKQEVAMRVDSFPDKS